MSRSEALLKYAEEHPEEVLISIEDRADALVRELEARERDARRALSRPIATWKRAPARHSVCARSSTRTSLRSEAEEGSGE